MSLVSSLKKGRNREPLQTMDFLVDLLMKDQPTAFINIDHFPSYACLSFLSDWTKHKHHLSLDDGRDLPKANPVGFSLCRLERTGRHRLDERTKCKHLKVC